ncbi:sodium:calcium antiporter [Ideonella sp. A 288]|uniref:sodium:calcium antiporter n=1 Tax=Ideonella sp. A 288 TaxID=1962181 RepID=UPI000B4BA043|nr:sodium:calcium antiporter [Ideonella sp. A 288]
MGYDWLQLAACALAIAYAGARLTRLADAIGEKTGMSGSWVGLLLLAAVTSLPELATGISAVTAAQSPDIAVGDVLGSTVFNLALLVMLDVLHRPDTIYLRAGTGHILSAGFGVILLGVVGASVLLEREHVLPGLGWVGGYTPLLGVLYLLAMGSVFSYERRQASTREPAGEPRHAGLSLRTAAWQFALFAGIVALAGVWLPIAGSRIADEMGWSRTFVGTLLVAGATSLPEVVVTLAALRLRALDMAIGGLLGSNLFDLLIIAVDDVFYTKGSLLADVSPMHAVTAFSAAMMSGAVIVGLVYRPHGRVLRTMSVVSAALLAVYLINVYVLFVHRE